MHYTCSLLSDGTVNCWGSNLYGQLGDRAERDSRPAQRDDGEQIDTGSGAQSSVTRGPFFVASGFIPDDLPPRVERGATSSSCAPLATSSLTPVSATSLP
ncbi:MAG: hypothetical protein HYT87_11220 [Nitrospirae bacterium]|nr:hypothetical protein [Nitrospirota bacterium]